MSSTNRYDQLPNARIDSSRIPAPLQPLLPFARAWGIMGDDALERAVRAVSRDEIARVVEAARPVRDLIFDFAHRSVGVVREEEPLATYLWSSFPLYLAPARRPAWLRVDRLLGEHSIQADTADGRIEFQRRLEDRRRESEVADEWAVFRRGWKLGASDFAQRLAERLGRNGHAHERARERSETDEQADRRRPATKHERTSECQRH